MTPDPTEALRVLLQVISAFEELGVAYHLGGSYASSIHGVPRQTQDIDLVVDLHAAAIPALCRRLERDFYCNEAALAAAVKSRGSANLVHFESALKIDIFVLGAGAYDQEEFRRHQAQVLVRDPERHIFVKSAEDILLRKLEWYRTGGEVSDRQWSDILGIVKTQGQRLDRDYLLLWADRIGGRDLLAKVLPEESS